MPTSFTPSTTSRRGALIGTIAVFACALAVAVAERSGATTSTIPAQVRAVHQLADLRANVEAFCATLVETAEATARVADHPTLSKLDATARTRWLAEIRGACEPDAATERHLRAFAVGYDPDSARAVTDWYASDPGRRLLLLEAAAGETDWESEVSPFIDRLTREPVDLERVKLFERIDAALQTTEDAAQLQVGIGEILTFAAQPLLPERERTDSAEIEQELAAMRVQMAQQLRQQQSVIFMFVYRDASTEELEAFAAFAESPGARWLNASHRMAMQRLVVELRQEIVARLGGA